MVDLTALRSAISNYESRVAPATRSPDVLITCAEYERMVKENKRLFSMILDILSRSQQ